MSDEYKQIIEVNGVKLEVDLRSAKKIEHFKVGDRVKVLVKKYSDSFSVHFGMIVGFDAFTELPTIIVAYLESTYNELPLKFVYINSKNKDSQICMADNSDLGLQKCDILGEFNKKQAKLEEELRDLEIKRKYFVDMFGRYFENNGNG